MFRQHSIDEWQHYDEVHEGQKIQNLAPAEYSEDDELGCCLVLRAECIRRLLALPKVGHHE